VAKKERREYTHQPLNDDFTSISGHYTLHKEVRQQYGDRELLYVIGQACMDSACCGTGNWDYGLVPGYIISWQTQTNEAGLPITEVEPIADARVKADIEHYVKDTESVSRVEFW
jgi:hypothetical protein